MLELSLTWDGTALYFSFPMMTIYHAFVEIQCPDSIIQVLGVIICTKQVTQYRVSNKRYSQRIYIGQCYFYSSSYYKLISSCKIIKGFGKVILNCKVILYCGRFRHSNFANKFLFLYATWCISKFMKRWNKYNCQIWNDLDFSLLPDKSEFYYINKVMTFCLTARYNLHDSKT